MKALRLLQEKCLSQSYLLADDQLTDIVSVAMEDFIVLTKTEASMVSGMVCNHINECGSIFNDRTRLVEENALREKLSIELACIQCGGPRDYALNTILQEKCYNCSRAVEIGKCQYGTLPPIFPGIASTGYRHCKLPIGHSGDHELNN